MAAQAGVTIVTTPTEKWLKDELASCEHRFLAASPYVTDYLRRLAAPLDSAVERTLLTSTDLRSFALGSSDIESLCKLADEGTKVLSQNGLHAKVYVVDDHCALVTSANATRSGMTKNHECGVAVDSAEIVSNLAAQILSGFGAAERPLMMGSEDLVAIRESIRAIRPLLPPMSEVEELIARHEQPHRLEVTDVDGLVESFSGWTRLALRGVFQQHDDLFSLDEVFSTCEPAAAEEYPNNKWPRAKLRQQLQRLRDLGMVDFLGGGSYRRTFTVT